MSFAFVNISCISWCRVERRCSFIAQTRFFIEILVTRNVSFQFVPYHTLLLAMSIQGCMYKFNQLGYAAVKELIIQNYLRAGLLSAMKITCLTTCPPLILVCVVCLQFWRQWSFPKVLQVLLFTCERWFMPILHITHFRKFLLFWLTFVECFSIYLQLIGFSCCLLLDRWGDWR